jgi:thymidylate synthase ThyX
MKTPITVKLISHTNEDPTKLIKFAKKECVMQQAPTREDLEDYEVDIDKDIFQTGHHTTFQHFYLTFQIEGLSIMDITLGLHLTHPFYNSDQRSASYAGIDFFKLEQQKIVEYINYFWPDLEANRLEKILSYIKKCNNLFFSNFYQAKELVKKELKKTRPYAGDEYLKKEAGRIAQSQLRMFLPAIHPTGLIYTANLTAFASMYEAAWNPVLRFITDRIKEEILDKFPNLDFLFNKDRRRKSNWAMSFEEKGLEKNEIDEEVKVDFEFEQNLKGLPLDNENGFIVPDYKVMYPLDKQHFTPELMNNNYEEIGAQIITPLAVMGQDQRHRTIRRSRPSFTGSFYLPPMAKKCNLADSALEILKDWKMLIQEIPRTLKDEITPLGASVKYKKRGSLNAICHEQAKRLCWYHPREVYEISRQLREAIQKKLKNHPLINLFEPLCYRKGKCFEGDRYCGRDLRLRKEESYFLKRKV